MNTLSSFTDYTTFRLWRPDQWRPSPAQIPQLDTPQLASKESRNSIHNPTNIDSVPSYRPKPKTLIFHFSHTSVTWFLLYTSWSAMADCVVGDACCPDFSALSSVVVAYLLWWHCVPNDLCSIFRVCVCSRLFYLIWTICLMQINKWMNEWMLLQAAVHSSSLRCIKLNNAVIVFFRTDETPSLVGRVFPTEQWLKW